MIMKGICFALFAAGLGYTAWRDRETKKIANTTLLALMILGCALIYLMPEVTINSRIHGALEVSGMMLAIALIRRKAFGGGDIKLMAICGFILGENRIWRAFFIALILAAIYSLGIIRFKGAERTDTIAFSPFLAIGVAVSFVLKEYWNALSFFYGISYLR